MNEGYLIFFSEPTNRAYKGAPHPHPSPVGGSAGQGDRGHVTSAIHHSMFSGQRLYGGVDLGGRGTPNKKCQCYMSLLLNFPNIAF